MCEKRERGKKLPKIANLFYAPFKAATPLITLIVRMMMMMMRKKVSLKRLKIMSDVVDDLYIYGIKQNFNCQNFYG